VKHGEVNVGASEGAAIKLLAIVGGDDIMSSHGSAFSRTQVGLKGRANSALGEAQGIQPPFAKCRALKGRSSREPS
jgi:hypothetical protein